jgi:hypothetical protein
MRLEFNRNPATERRHGNAARVAKPVSQPRKRRFGSANREDTRR